MLNSFVLRVEPFAGHDITGICAEMIALANRVDCRVEAKCNGVIVWARPGDDADALFAAWEEQRRRPARYRRIAEAREAGNA